MRVIRCLFIALGVAFASADAITYCGMSDSDKEMVGPRVTGDGNLGPVTIEGNGGTFISENSNCPGERFVQVFPQAEETTSISAGGKYEGAISVSSCIGSAEGTTAYPRFAKVWIDYNANGEFEENAGELVFSVSVPGEPVTGEYVFEFEVPGNATSGDVGLRVAVIEGNAVEPCQSYTYGSMKHFTITIGAATGLSLGWIIIILLVVSLVLYLAYGFFLARRRGESGIRDILPHQEFWSSLPGLVKDGCEFTILSIKSGIQRCRGGSNYSRFESDNTYGGADGV